MGEADQGWGTRQRQLLSWGPKADYIPAQLQHVSANQELSTGGGGESSWETTPWRGSVGGLRRAVNNTAILTLNLHILQRLPFFQWQKQPSVGMCILIYPVQTFLKIGMEM